MRWARPTVWPTAVYSIPRSSPIPPTTTSPELMPDPDQEVEPLRAAQLGAELAQPLDQVQRGEAGALRMVLMGDGRAEDRHDPVAGELVDRALELVDAVAEDREEAVHDVRRHSSGSTLLGEVHRAHHVGEQHGHLLAFPFETGRGRRGSSPPGAPAAVPASRPRPPPPARPADRERAHRPRGPGSEAVPRRPRSASHRRRCRTSGRQDSANHRRDSGSSRTGAHRNPHRTGRRRHSDGHRMGNPLWAIVDPPGTNGQFGRFSVVANPAGGRCLQRRAIANRAPKRRPRLPAGSVGTPISR